MSFHRKVLSTTQQNLLKRIGPSLTDHGFYLAGGTALAIQLGHRRSVDFDWFTGDSIQAPLRLAQRLRDDGIPLRVQETAEGTIHATVSRVRVSFFEYRYEMLREPIAWPAFGCVLASLEDIVCMKLAAVAQRGSKKDFVDVYALGRRQFTLKEMLDLYKRRFDVDDIAHVLYSLAYFDDADAERMPQMVRPVRWPVVKQTIRSWICSFAA